MPAFSNGIYLSRIMLGATVFIHCAMLLAEFPQLFGESGIFPYDFVPGSSPQLYLFLIVGCIVTSVAFALGFYTRLIGLVLIVFHTYLTSATPYMAYGWKNVIPFFILYLILMDCGERLSIDSKSKDRKAMPIELRNSVYFVYVLHVSLIYFVPSLLRLEKSYWIDGEAVFIMMNTSMWGRFIPFTFAENSWYLTLLTYFFATVELIAPILLFSSIFKYAVYLLILMHVGVELLLNVGMWSEVMISLLVGLLTFERLFPRDDGTSEGSE